MEKFLTKEQIKNVDDLTVEIVDVESWGGKVGVKALTAVEREELRKDIGDDPTAEVDIIKVQMKMLSLTLVDENHERLFTTNEDIEWLKNKSASELDKLFKIAQTLSGLGEKSTEEIEKN